MILEDLIKGVSALKICGDSSIEINKISFDSRKIEDGDVFVAISGVEVDGHNYIDSAISKGVKTVVCEILPNNINEEITYILVEDSSIALSIISSNYYCNPSSKIKLVGVTGTNGKTTIASLLFQLFRNAGYKVGLMSTVVNKINEIDIKADHTTPDVLSINSLLSEMVESGCEYCFMEVSSHGICQNRVANLDFDVAIFTNITHDHLDYHKTFAAYIKAKKKFFDNLSKNSVAIVNLDDKNGMTMLQNSLAVKKTFSIKGMADYKAKVIERGFEGMLIDFAGSEVMTSLIGDYNASNLLAVYAAADSLGMDKMEILINISKLYSVDGRMDRLISKKGVLGIVDYAHTPDALKNVLENIQYLKSKNQQIITVVGCGGDRDKSKRPEMAEIGAKYSDRLILTSDNPRTEDPNEILKDMESGLSDDQKVNTLTISDRYAAIKTSYLLSNKGDIILIAGKGHENYQDINGVKTHFDDKETLKEIFNN
ncbi:MAG: UDP-N-acetylmuramoyl-L-alanyl-D-glutamate--2,6-diaminopimelate ligase [Marinifilaceae bacterium]|jgi:UDP-N-acetylmuramoyl-L-alanyl-D-glutamate--2,6-diaminopimelate ligase|nr:UDP-N-acetylmuramoyl-L-alanyl-D-glutamate--2,6-diaminopimelate ligase [Marinifilaceae bacterium]